MEGSEKQDPPGNALRVAYVNVQGLGGGTWEQVLDLLAPKRLDLIFVAETWYVGFDRYARASTTIAYTPKPETKAGSRYTGGLCLVATDAVRKRISARPTVTASTIALSIGGSRIAGIYLPPSMSDTLIGEALAQVQMADVVLGDINVRYNERTGIANPKDRAALLAAWAQRYAMYRLDPHCGPSPITEWALAPALTVDHCFVRRQHILDPLYLLSNHSLCISTDHVYTLLLSLSEPAPPIHNSPVLPRFRMGMLSKAGVRERLIEFWQRDTAGMEEVLTPRHDVDLLNDFLVAACQRACRRVLGEVTVRLPAQAQTRPANPSHFQLVRQIFRLDGQNGPLYSTDPTLTALEEAANVLRERYLASSLSRSGFEDYPALPQEPLSPTTLDSTNTTINSQDASKACGTDGVHIQVVKALRQTSLPLLLTTLYNACLFHQRTPKAWNLTDIQLIVKDPSKTKTIFNARPITLPCTFRKIFECTLLARMLRMPCLRLHPAQAGFRANYSTHTLAALVHVALEQKLCAGVIFLDFHAAFDMVDLTLLRERLCYRGCSEALIRMLDALETTVQSRILSNGGASLWFERTRGVVQGFPLSPLLWNIMADDLLEDLNREATGLPKGVFYADDGALLYNDVAEIPTLLACVRVWCTRNGIEVNVSKCGHISSTDDGAPVYWGDHAIPKVAEYRYLGFPVTSRGIDFEAHLKQRMDQALARARYLARHSSSWGVANRLQTYRQYLAPIIEYGAPLVWAWASQDPHRWTQANSGWKELMQWIANGKHGWRLSQNLLGLPALPDRFETLHSTFLFDLQRAEPSNPLRRMLFQPGTGGAYRRALRESPLLTAWRRSTAAGALDKAALHRYQRTRTGQKLACEAHRSHMTALTWESRLRTGMSYADRTLQAPQHMQDTFFQYRRGVWSFRFVHRCANRTFRRGDEECACQGRIARLSRRDRRMKNLERARVGNRGLFTNVDFLLNSGQWYRAYGLLQQVRAGLAPVTVEEDAEDPFD